ncbi:MAG: hypothetical protein PHI45_01530 [Candidatus Pacebacteria bacterium]|nr:hypothetical protein [Candidatus Paceibacterota bacterium]MDD5013290.1 hypothetical protein [Candidatus Paceibacterota bacterium]MDD5752749.1 hypothetical protein [Candidatus Paceibacterota bacterium]
MDIYVEKKFAFEKIIPIILLIVIFVIIFYVFQFLNKKEQVNVNLNPLPVPIIDYEFLTKIDSLESFPQYTIFIPDEGPIGTARPNPFSPLSK